MKKVISILLVLAMLLSMAGLNTFAASPETVTQLADKLYYHKNSFYSENAKGDINENYFVYSPNTSVTPYLCHGNDVAGAASMNRVFTLESDAGNTLIAAVNGDYFITSNGVPIGIEIKDGIIKSSSHSEYTEIGFTANGSAIIGRSDLVICLTDITNGVTFTNIHYNKGLTTDSVPTLFTSAFEDTNRADYNTVNVVIEITGGEPRANQTVTGVVKEVVDAESNCTLNQDEMILAIYSNQDPEVIADMQSCEPGDKIKVEFSMDRSWNNVTQALGGKEMLVEAGEAKKFSDGTRAPRTALGVKPNGDLVVYTCDGRDYGGSKGLSLTELARRMLQLGCIKAINLDGGASTQAHVVFPGNTTREQVNEDAGSSLRSCANYICFKNNESPTGIVANLYAYPSSVFVAADSEVALNIKACDTNWYPVLIDASDLECIVSGRLGTVQSGKFIAGTELGSGKITVKYGNVSTTLDVTVATDWPEISASYASGSLIATITDPLGVGIDESNIKLTVDGKAVDFTYASGVLYAGFTEMDGLLHHAIITAKNSKEHISRYALSMTFDEYEAGDGEGASVDTTPIFADLKNSDWSKSYIEYLYRQGIISGSKKNGKLYYNPSAKMTRQEFAKVITTWYGVDLTKYETVELDFADNSKIANWAMPYVKAAVSLGMMNGKSVKGVNKFDPEGSITRQEVMTVIGRIMADGYQSDNLSEFSDKATIADWALPYVKVLVKQGIITGSNGKLLPNNAVTREQVAKIIFEIN